MTKEREALKLTLVALKELVEKFDSEQFTSICELDEAKEAIEAAEEALAQPEHEKYCSVCQGCGQLDTGIMESPVTICNTCNGTGLKAQPEQEPYAWEFAGTIFHDKDEVFAWYERGDVSNIPPLPLYTSPQTKEKNNA